MPQSANDQVELPIPTAATAGSNRFQCLSRQTIKWNSQATMRRPAPGRFNASVGKRSSGTVYRIGSRSRPALFQCLSRQTIKWNLQRRRSGWLIRFVSMPQSANDQVEPARHRRHQPGPAGFQCLSRQTIKWNSSTAPSSPRATRVSMPQSANDQVEPRFRSLGAGRYTVSMPQSANDQVEHCPLVGGVVRCCRFNASVGKRSSGTGPMSEEDAFDDLFQCLSRQTIKWNSADIGKLSQRTGVSMPQSANDQVELDYDTPETLFYIVSMPQSANDQVERECSQMDQGFGKWVSMPQSANDQVELRRYRQTESEDWGFNASVGKRSSGTRL